MFEITESEECNKGALRFTDIRVGEFFSGGGKPDVYSRIRYGSVSENVLRFTPVGPVLDTVSNPQYVVERVNIKMQWSRA